MKVNKIGINYNHNGSFMIDRPNGSGDYLFLLIKTPAVFELNGQKQIAEKNSIILYRKGTPQKYYAYGPCYSNDFIQFDADSDRELRSFPTDTLFVLPTTVQVSKILKEIYLEYISSNLNRFESMELLLKLLIVKISELAAPDAFIMNNYYDALLELRSLIYRHPEEKWTVSRLSRHVSLSPSHFERLYKKTFGVTSISDVISSKIEYAKTSLLSTKSSVREIAGMCGYDNEEHFMRQFKQTEGITPTQYRKKMRGTTPQE